MMMMLKTDTLSEAFMGTGWKCTETVPPSLLTSLSSVSNVQRKRRRSGMKRKGGEGGAQMLPRAVAVVSVRELNCTYAPFAFKDVWQDGSHVWSNSPHPQHSVVTVRWEKALMHCHQRSPLSCLDLPSPSVPVRQARTESRTNALVRFSMGHHLV